MNRSTTRQVSRTLPLFAFAAVIAALVAPGGADAKSKRLIKLGTNPDRIIQVGYFRPDYRAPRADPSVRAARKHFGKQSRSTRTRDGSCVMKWNRLGLTITFNLPQSDRLADRGLRSATAACTRGEATEIEISGKRGEVWKTDRKIGVGSPVERMQHAYPDAEYQGVGTFSVVRQELKFGQDPFFDLFTAYGNSQVRVPRVMTMKFLPLAALYPDSERRAAKTKARQRGRK